MSIFAPSIKQDPEKKSLGNISADQLNSNQQVTPVPYLAGRRILAGSYISPAYNQRAVPRRTQVGKGDSQIIGYDYYADFVLVFCMGGRRPVDAIYKVIVESEIVWEGTVVRGGADYEEIVVADFGTLRIYWGSATQAVDGNLVARGSVTGGIDTRDQSTWPNNPPTGGQTTDNGEASGDFNPLSGHYDGHPPYHYQSYGVFLNWKLGRDRTSIPNTQVELGRGVPFVSGGLLTTNDLGVNACAVVYDIVTDPICGAGLPDAKLLTASWTATKTAVDAARVSPLVTNQEDLRSIVDKGLGYFEGWLRRNGKLLEIGYWAHGNINPAGLPQLFDDDLDGEPELKPTSFGNTVNQVTVAYKDRNHYYNDRAQTARDLNNRRIVGLRRIQMLQQDWLTDPDLATQAAAEARTILAQPSQPGMLTIKRERIDALGILPGDRFVWNSALYALSIVCRFLEMEWPEDRSGKVKCTIEAERGLWPNHYSAPPVKGDGDFHIGPNAIVRARLIELPDPLKPVGENEVQLVALAQRQNTFITGFRVHVSSDGGSTYDLAESRNNFSAFGRIDTFDPIPTLSGLKLWLKADAMGGSLSDGDPVTTWNDSSGLGNHVTQATAGKKPIWNASDPYNLGMPSVTFDGVDDYLRSTSGGFNGPHTIYAAFTNAQNQVGHVLSWGESVTGKMRSILLWDQGTGTWRVMYWIQNSQLVTTIPPLGHHVFAFVVDGASNVNVYWYDFLVASGTLTFASMSGTIPFTVGANAAATPIQFASVNIGELAVFDSAHSTADRTKVIDYLSSKFRQSAMVRLYGVDSDRVVSQTPQAQADFTLLGFLDDADPATATEIVSVGTVIARGDGLFRIVYRAALYGTPGLTHAPNARCWFIFRNRIVAVANENFIPGATRSFKLQATTARQEYDLASITPFNYTFEIEVPVPMPALAPSSCSFVGSQALTAIIPTGYIGRYTTDDTAVRTNSRVWPGGGITVSQTCVVRLRCYTPNGRGGEEARCFYTELSGGTPVQTCGAVSASYSGARGRTNGNLTLQCATSGATIKYSKNAAAFATYSTPLALVVGDIVEYYALKATMSDSAHGYFDNTRTVTDGGGGGYGGGGGGGHYYEH